MIDLHVHSTASDGSLPPAAIVHTAVEAGLQAVALTDHDTLAGLPEFMEAGRTAPLETVPGIEIACRWYTINLHIVGLYVQSRSAVLERLAARIREARDRRNLEMIERLHDLGLSITLDAVREQAGGESIGRPHMARALVAAGYCSEVREAFERWLGRGRPAYVRRRLPPPAEVIRAIHAAGGAAIWAHPAATRPGGPSRIRQVLRRLVPLGLDGIEVLYPDHTPRQISALHRLTTEFGLLPSGGSDFHGANIPELELGRGRGDLCVPDDWLPPLRSRAEAYAAPTA